MLRNSVEVVKDAASQVQRQMAYGADVAKASLVDAALGAKDAAIEAVVGQAEKVVGLGQSVFKIPYIELPLSIAFIVAPVPMAVGCGLMFIMDWKLDETQSRLKRRGAEARARRQFDRTVDLLQKHGHIPETAVLETEHIRLEINSTLMGVTGSVKTGWYASRCLPTLDDAELNHLIVMSTDPDTLEILRAYRQLRSKMRDHQEDHQ